MSKRETYTVVDYVFTTDNTFSNRVAQECRGLKFDSTGRIIARPFHKFFNIGEKERPEDVDWTRPHVVMDKLDGSMIHPCLLEGDLVFMTRMGVTDQARAASAHVTPQVRDLSLHLLTNGQTPVFEFTSPDNRIVVDYAQPAITLLAVRDTITGVYMAHDALEDLGATYGVPVVETVDPVSDIRSFIAQGRALQGAEGYVVAFDDGHRVKLKADAYVLRHKALAGVAYEKNLVAWIAADALDDVLPILHADVADQVRAYHAGVMIHVQQHLDHIAAVLATVKGEDRRAVAMAVQAQVDKRLQPVAFALRDGRDGRAAMMKLLAWAGHTETRIDKIRDLFGLSWSGAGFMVKDA